MVALRPFSRPAAPHSKAPVHTEKGCTPRRLPAYPRNDLRVLHQGFLTEAAPHMQHVERGRIGQAGISRQSQSLMSRPDRTSFRKCDKPNWESATELQMVPL
jgi:hypothetical protein